MAVFLSARIQGSLRRMESSGTSFFNTIARSCANRVLKKNSKNDKQRIVFFISVKSSGCLIGYPRRCKGLLLRITEFFNGCERGKIAIQWGHSRQFKQVLCQWTILMRLKLQTPLLVDNLKSAKSIQFPRISITCPKAVAPTFTP